MESNEISENQIETPKKRELSLDQQEQVERYAQTYIDKAKWNALTFKEQLALLSLDHTKYELREPTLEEQTEADERIKESERILERIKNGDYTGIIPLLRTDLTLEFRQNKLAKADVKKYAPPDPYDPSLINQMRVHIRENPQFPEHDGSHVQDSLHKRAIERQSKSLWKINEYLHMLNFLGVPITRQHLEAEFLEANKPLSMAVRDTASSLISKAKSKFKK